LLSSPARVRSGLEILLEQAPVALAGRTVGLLANQASVNGK
jgi:hypothetical protein